MSASTSAHVRSDQGPGKMSARAPHDEQRAK
jgi:hypothetical protein